MRTAKSGSPGMTSLMSRIAITSPIATSNSPWPRWSPLPLRHRRKPKTELEHARPARSRMSSQQPRILQMLHFMDFLAPIGSSPALLALSILVSTFFLEDIAIGYAGLLAAGGAISAPLAFIALFLGVY